MKTTIDNIHKETIKRYGKIAMINKAIQEFQECTVALTDRKYGLSNESDIMEELQDCKNMIRKMEVLFNFDTKECKEIQTQKMIRTYQRLMSESPIN